MEDENYFGGGADGNRAEPQLKIFAVQNAEMNINMSEAILEEHKKLDEVRIESDILDISQEAERRLKEIGEELNDSE
jgi:hypothetical protein